MLSPVKISIKGVLLRLSYAVFWCPVTAENKCSLICLACHHWPPICVIAWPSFRADRILQAAPPEEAAFEGTDGRPARAVEPRTGAGVDHARWYLSGNATSRQLAAIVRCAAEGRIPVQSQFSTPSQASLELKSVLAFCKRRAKPCALRHEQLVLRFFRLP
jgi:hypothetical protein